MSCVSMVDMIVEAVVVVVVDVDIGLNLCDEEDKKVDPWLLENLENPCGRILPSDTTEMVAVTVCLPILFSARHVYSPAS